MALAGDTCRYTTKHASPPATPLTVWIGDDMAVPAIRPDYREPALGQRPSALSVPTQHPCPGATSQPTMDREQVKATAYAAVTAHLARDDEQVARLVHELLQHPTDAATALLALLQACRGLTEWWGHDTQQEPLRLWASYLEATGCRQPVTS